jgi:ABC-2 type transport system permease protein
VMVKPDLVVDRRCGSATFSTGFIRYTLPYMLWPMTVKSGFDQDSPVTNQLERAVFPWTSSIEFTKVEGSFSEMVVLAKSSQMSWSEERQLDLNPQRQFTPTTEARPRNLAVLLSGSFESFFEDREVPMPEGAEAIWEGEKLLRSPETQIVVIGNARMIENDFLGQYPENRVFFLNAIDWLTLGESLIGIRSRAVTARPLKEVGERGKATIRFASTFGISIALIAWGLLRRYVRSSRRATLLEQGVRQNR